MCCRWRKNRSNSASTWIRAVADSVVSVSFSCRLPQFLVSGFRKKLWSVEICDSQRRPRWRGRYILREHCLLGNRPMPDKTDISAEEILARQALDLERLKDAFGLLGVNPCSWCKKFVRRTEPGALFDAGELICYGCVPEWWAQRCAQLSTKERENPRRQAGLLAARLSSR
jgi:hypothetical protein